MLIWCWENWLASPFLASPSWHWQPRHSQLVQLERLLPSASFMQREGAFLAASLHWKQISKSPRSKVPGLWSTSVQYYLQTSCRGKCKTWAAPRREPHCWSPKAFPGPGPVSLAGLASKPGHCWTMLSCTATRVPFKGDVASGELKSSV